MRNPPVSMPARGGARVLTPVLFLPLLAVIGLSGAALAANEPPAPQMAPLGPGQVVTGSPSVTIDGRPAARQGDTTSNDSAVRDGSPNVFINGKPAATVGNRSECGGAIITGSPSVFINGRPVATGGSLTNPCPR